MSSIVFSGLMIEGYAVVDEFILLCIVFAFLISDSLKKKYQKTYTANPPIVKIHQSVYLLLMTYLIFQSFRGMVVLEDFRIIRFVVYFFMLGIVTIIFNKSKISFPSSQDVSGLIVYSGLIYFLAYIFQGGSIDYASSGRYLTQGNSWVGTAVAFFPLIVIVPAIYLYISSGSMKSYLVSITLIIIIFFSCVYYSSRIGLLYLVGSFIFFILYYRGKKSLLFFLILLIIITVGQLIFFEEKDFIKADLFYLYETVSNNNPSDLGRLLHIKAGFVKLLGDPISLFIGDGFYVNRFSIKETLEKIGYGSLSFSGSLQTVGITAFIVDTGLMGIFLLCVNIYLTIKTVFLNNRKYFPIALLVFFFMIQWLFITNMQDMVLFFLLFMPNGLLLQLIGQKDETNYSIKVL